MSDLEKLHDIRDNIPNLTKSQIKQLLNETRTLQQWYHLLGDNELYYGCAEIITKCRLRLGK